MDKQSTPFWRPTPDVIARAHVTHLAAALGVDGFDALRALSIAEPDWYWKHVLPFLGVRWSRPYRDYVDLADGPEFPRWFVGGELNWTDTIFSPDHPRDRVAVIAETEAGATGSITYGELQEQVGRFAAGLTALGVRRGDCVGLLMEMGVESVVAFLATSHMGAIAAPLFTGFGAEAIVSRLSACGASVLVATAGFNRRGRWVDTASMIDAIRPDLPALRHMISKGSRTSPAPEQSAPATVSWDDVMSSGTPGPSARMEPDEPMMVIYTSGTTGKPKGAVHTHGGFPLKVAHDSAVHYDVGPGDVFFWPADLGWVAGSINIAASLMRGATLVCYDGAPDTPDWSRLPDIIARYGVTHFGASPTLVRGFAANEPLSTTGDFSTVRILLCAGEVIAPEHMVWFQRSFGRGECPVINYTGGTEVSGGLFGNVVVRPIVAAAFNAISPGVDADVLDDAGRPVRDVIGELSILAPFVGMTRSFWHDRERYLDSYWRQHPGIWTHGDLALRTGGDVLFLLGRSDDTLKVAGKRVGPAEIEDVVLELPGVREVAAIGIEDAAKGQNLVVFVIPRTLDGLDHAAFEKAVTQTVALRLGKPFQPGRVHVVSDLPRTKSLKIMRRVLRRVYVGEEPGDLTSLENPAAIDVVRNASREPR